MRIWKNREDSLKFGLSFLLILGSVIGSLVCNGMSDEMKMELHVVEQNMVTAASLAKADFRELFLWILPKRLSTLMIVLLMSATPSAPILLMGAAGYLGFRVALIICPLTMDAGFRGLWQYVLLIFPQCLIYIPVIFALIWWMPINRKRLTLLSAILLFAVVTLGVAAESMLNPWFLQFL